MKMGTFFVKLDRVFKGKFFSRLERMSQKIHEEEEYLRLYRERRITNGPRAGRVLARLRRVEAIDLFKMTQHIKPDFFQSKRKQFDAVIELGEKKGRIVWYLNALYNYLAFDDDRHFLPYLGTNSYSHHRAYYYELLEDLAEKVKQAKWDKKKARVRARRDKMLKTKDGTPYAIQRGVNNILVIPLPVPTVGDDGIVWDDEEQ